MSIRRCRFCATEVKADPAATYGVVGVDGSLCCPDRIPGCPACADGEAHPHETALAYAHQDYPHEPGRLPGCPACEARCHCDPDPGTTACVYDGPEDRYGKHAVDQEVTV